MVRFPSPASIISRYHNGLRRLLAQQGIDWGTAAALWRKVAGATLSDRTTALGHINALIGAGRLEEAEAQSAALLRRKPNDANGRAALARIAEARGETSRAIGYWRAMLDISPGHRQALIRLGQALLSTAQFEEAQDCSNRLSARFPRDPEGPLLAAQIAQQKGGFEAAASLWSRADQKFGNNAAFLRAYGHGLLEAGEYHRCAAVAERLRKLDLAEGLRLHGQLIAKREPYKDHTDFWKGAAAQIPASIDFTRKLLHAALWARRQREAQTAFERLLKQRRLRASDADYTFGLGIALLEKGDKAGARATVRAFLHAMRGRLEYYASALRLVRLILTCFPSESEAAVSISRHRSRFIRMIRNARLSTAAAEPLEQIAQLEAKFEESGATCLLDTDIDPNTCGAFVRLLRHHLSNRQPFSLIRLGDGEANALPYANPLKIHFPADATERERVWWGRALDDNERAQLAACVSAAITNADALGIPTTARMLRDIRLDSGRPLAATRSGRGLLAILAMLEQAAESHSLSGKVLVSAHIHQDMERWNLYGALFHDTEMITASCHETLPNLLRSRFDAHLIKHLLIPPGDAMREREQRSLRDDELPPQYLDRVIAELGVNLEGVLVAVGAGYAGKIIVDEARKRGGVALDLGSIFDHWAGVHTRSYQDIA